MFELDLIHFGLHLLDEAQPLGEAAVRGLNGDSSTALRYSILDLFSRLVLARCGADVHFDLVSRIHAVWHHQLHLSTVR